MSVDDLIRVAVRHKDARNEAELRRVFGLSDSEPNIKLDELPLQQQIEHHEERRLVAERRIAGIEHGLPIESASKIAGNTPAEMAKDAKTMAEQRTRSMDDRLRDAA
jgi:hypothetical protein